MSQNHLVVLHLQTPGPYHLQHLQQLLLPLSLLLFQSWYIYFHYNLVCLDKYPNNIKFGKGGLMSSLKYLDILSHLIHIFSCPSSVVSLVGNVTNYNWCWFLDCSKDCICLNLKSFIVQIQLQMFNSWINFNFQLTLTWIE